MLFSGRGQTGGVLRGKDPHVEISGGKSGLLYF